MWGGKSYRLIVDLYMDNGPIVHARGTKTLELLSTQEDRVPSDTSIGLPDAQSATQRFMKAELRPGRSVESIRRRQKD